MNHIGLFEGLGGFMFAVAMMGWNTLAWCEINQFCQTILKYYFPNVQGYGDIRTADLSIFEGQSDLVTAGFPCQPFSTAGKRKGTDDGRYLWPENLQSLRILKPPAFIGENVTGLLTMEKREVFARVDSRNLIRYQDFDQYEAVYTRQAEMLLNSICEDLEKEGYQVQTFVVPAAGAGAPHRRDRVFIVAYSHEYNARRQELREAGSQEAKAKSKKSKWKRFWPYPERTGHERHVTYSNIIDENISGLGASQISQSQKAQIQQNFATNSVPNPDKFRLEGSKRKEKGQYSIDRGPWSQFPTQSPVCSRNDGFASRLDSITFPGWRNQSMEALGNAVVPQAIIPFLIAIENLINDGKHAG